MIPLIQPGSGKVLRMAEESADFWRSLGYADPAPDPAEHKDPPRKRAAKKSDDE